MFGRWHSSVLSWSEAPTLESQSAKCRVTTSKRSKPFQNKSEALTFKSLRSEAFRFSYEWRHLCIRLAIFPNKDLASSAGSFASVDIEHLPQSLKTLFEPSKLSDLLTSACSVLGARSLWAVPWPNVPVLRKISEGNAFKLCSVINRTQYPIASSGLANSTMPKPVTERPAENWFSLWIEAPRPFGLPSSSSATSALLTCEMWSDVCGILKWKKLPRRSPHRQLENGL